MRRTQLTAVLVVFAMIAGCKKDEVLPADVVTATCEAGTTLCISGQVWNCIGDGSVTPNTTCTDDELCVDGACKAPVPLLDAEGWTVVEGDDDPFWAARPDPTVLCDKLYFSTEDAQPTIEGSWFKLATDGCNYGTAKQAIAAAITAGDTLRVQIHHYPLLDPLGDYKIQLKLEGDDAVLWEQAETVPAEQSWIQSTVEAPKDYPAGTPIYWHLENHGINEWAIYNVTIAP